MIDIPVVLLVGGMGTRLRSVLPGTPKPLAAVGDSSFLGLLVRQLRHQGMRRLVMCTGYLGDQIKEEFRDGAAWGVSIQYSRDEHPLGTAGAIKRAQPCLQEATNFLVMNGDSFLEIAFEPFIRFHHGHGGLASMAVRQVDDPRRYGTVRTASDGRVTGFAEKGGTAAPGLVNAGVYVFDRGILDYIADGPVSLERDVFPYIVDRGVYALEHRGIFIDIGIPEDYARAQALAGELSAAVVRTGRSGHGVDAEA